MKNLIAVVTGGAGFIGSHVVDLLLSEGFEVRVIDNFSGGHRKNLNQHQENPNLKIFEDDIRSLSSNCSIFKGVKFVFHLAGIGDIVPSIEHPKDYLSVNVQGTVNVLECSRFSGAEKLVYAASSSCYGIADIPTTENHIIQPQYPYALSKYQGEQAALHWEKVYNLPVNSIRIFNAYGPRVRTTGAYGAVFGVFLKQKLSNKPLTVVGDGTQKRDFVFVTDVARAFYQVAQSNEIGQIYNLGAGDPQSINYLVKLIGGEVVYLPERPGEPEVTWADIDLIKKQTNWQPKVSFEKGVNIMLEDIKKWEDAPLWDPKSIEKATETWFRYLSKNNQY